MMTDLENFRATVNHERPGRILFHADFVPDLHRRVIEHIGTKDISGHYGMSRTASVSMKRPEGVEPPDYSKYHPDLPEKATITDLGVGWVPGDFYHFWEYVSPLRNATSLSEIENYPIEDQSGWDCSHMKAEVDQAHADGRYVIGFVGHNYEDAWQIRGNEQFLMDMIDQPAWAQCLFDRIGAANKNRAVQYAKAGVDLLMCGDDIANQNSMMFSPDVWRKMLLPVWRDAWQAVKEISTDSKIWYHSDGSIMPAVGDLVEAGVDILNPLQPECLDVDEVHRRYGQRVTFDGCIGTQTTMPFGTPDDVRNRVKEVIDKYGRNGGLMVSPTHDLEPEVPLANIDAFCEACREYGAFE